MLKKKKWRATLGKSVSSYHVFQAQSSFGLPSLPYLSFQVCMYQTALLAAATYIPKWSVNQ